MGRNKRKFIEKLSEEDSFKQNHSSLNVNLSCSSNLTDSGNETFRPMELVSQNTLADSMRVTRSTRSRTRLKTPWKNNVGLKDASVVLEDICTTDISLNKRSKNEACFLKSIPNHGRSHQSEKNQLFHKICTTPEKQNVLQEHNNNKIDTIYTSPSTHRSSPILAQNRRKLNASKFLLPKPTKLSTKSKVGQSQFRCLNNYKKQSSQSSVSSALSDESMLGAFPIACSSMLEECTNSQSKQSAAVEDNNINFHGDLHVDKSLLPMELTDVRGGFIVEKSNTLVHRSESSKNSSITHKSKENNIATKNYLSTSNGLSASIMQRSKSQYSMKQQEVNTNHLSLTAHPNSDDIEESRNSIQSSLNVNTSIDKITENNKAYRKRKGTIRIQNRQSNSVPRAVHDSCKIIFEEEQESVNTVNASLQMNTSLREPCRSSFMQDDINQSHRFKNNMEGSAFHGTSSIDTIQIYNKENSSNITRNNENITQKQQTTEEQYITTRNKSKSTVSGKSYIEATPYPPTRSMIWRSLAKYNTEMLIVQGDTVDTTNNSTNIEKRGYQEHRFNVMQKDTIMSQIEKNIAASIAKNTTINLDDSDATRLPPRKNRHSVIIVDSDAEISQTKDVDSISTRPKKHKKKLLPMREDSGLLSFSPMDESDSTPTQSIFPRTRENTKKKDTKRKTKNVAFHDSASKQTQKKPKRTRMIKSKKIIIKKGTNVDILTTLERERGEPDKNLNSTHYNTASPSDFETQKYIPTRKSTRGLYQKVVIVTTGLSREDKALIKSVVKSIGKATIESKVSSHTTYVITTGVRTLNLLHGIIRGCWLVTMEWILKSLENEQWLNPVKYEIPHFSKAVTAHRRERLRAEQFGVSHVPDLFAAAGLIYVESDTSPSSNDLKDLIKVGGGRITENEHNAKTIVGSTGLKESWVLDSITTGELQPYAQYKRN